MVKYNTKQKNLAKTKSTITILSPQTNEETHV